MANRRPLVLNSSGYQEYFQSADTLQVDGSITINGTSFSSAAPLIISGTGESNLGDSAIVGLFTADSITVDSTLGDNISITLGSNGDISASGRVNTSSLDINASQVIDGVLDEDSLTSDSNTKLATQQSIKKYVDDITKIVKFAGDSGNGNIQAGSTDTLTISGSTNQISTTVSGDQITLSLDPTIDVDAVETDSLQLGTSTIVTAILDEDNFSSDSASSLATQQSIKAFSENYTDTQIAAIPDVTTTVRGLMVATDKVKIDGIESGATADQTGAEIKALYEQEANAYTDTKNTKLAGIETGATADQTAAEVRVLVGDATDSNVFTDADHSKLDGIESGATADLTGAEIKSLYEQETSAFTDAQFTKLGGIEPGATADQTGAEIKALYEQEADAYTDTKNTKLAGIETGATADQTDAEIRAAVEAATDSNVFTDADHTKLDGIEAGSEVNLNHDLTYTASTRALEINNASGITLPEVTTAVPGLSSATDKSKLDGVEIGATADQTAAEIRALVASASDSNVLTDSRATKLDDITAQNLVDLDNLPGNLTDKADLDSNGKILESQIPDLAITQFLGTVTAQANLTTLSGELGDFASVSNEGILYVITANDGSTSTDWMAMQYPASSTNISYTASTRQVDSNTGSGFTFPEVVSGGNSGLMTGAQATKLLNISAGAEVNADTNLTYTASNRTMSSSTGTDAVIPHVVASGNSGLISGADKAKLDGVEAGATADQTASEILTAIKTVDGSGSGLDADTLDGLNLHTGRNDDANKVVRTNGSGYIDAGWINTTSGSHANTVTKVYSTYTTDGYIRYCTPNHLANSMTNVLHSDAADTFSGDLTSSGSARILLKKTDNNVSDHIIFYNGTTRMGEIGCEDTTWLRINQETNKNIYTPRYIRADAGFFVDGTTKGINGSGNFIGGTIAGASDYSTLLRANAADTATGRIAFQGCATNNHDNIATSSGSQGSIEVYNTGVGNDAFMAFHSGSDYALYFGLDADNNSLSVGGWSMGASKYKIWHAGNDGSGSGLDADLLDGVHASDFLRSDDNDTASGDITFNGRVNIRGHIDLSDSEYLYFGSSDDNYIYYNANNWMYMKFGGNGIVFQDGGTHKMVLEDSGIFRPAEDGDGYIGTNADRWLHGYFDNVSVTSTLTVRGAIDLADNDILRFGTVDDCEFFTNGSHMYMDLNSGIGNFYIRDGTTTRYTFDDNGSFTATGNVTAYSDIKLKKNVELIPNALDKVCELRGVTYDRIDLEGEENQRQSGVIAQEVEKVLPEVVSTNEEGIKSVAYGNMVGLLIESIKELKAEIETLKKERN